MKIIDQSTIDILSITIMLITLIIYNIAIVRLLKFTLSNIDFKDALSEKNVTNQPVAPPQGGAAAPAAAVAGAAAAPAGSTDPVASYSRVAGAIGAVVIAAFFWALGNVILSKAFFAIGDIKDLLTYVLPYFLAGSALFLPYAFNQLKSIFT